MADILKESVLLLRSIRPYSELIKDFSSNENIKELPMFKRKASSEESLIPRNIKKLSENKKNSKYTQRPNELDLKISCAIVLYQRFYSRIPNLQDVKNYLYCIEVLIEHLISEYYDNLEDIKKILQNYFFYEIRSALYVLKETMLKDSPVYNKEKIEILKLFIDFLDANRKNLNDYYNSSKFIGDLKIILINIEGFTSDISTIDPETIHFEIEILKDNIYEIILNKFFESEESNMYLLSIMENRSIDKEYKNEIIKKIKSFSIKSHYPMGSLMLDSVEELLPNYFEFKLIDINKSREFVRNFKIKYQNIIEKSISQFLGNKIENQLNPDLVLVQLISTFVEFYSVLHPKMDEQLKKERDFFSYFSLKSMLLHIMKLPRDHQAIILSVLNTALYSRTAETYESLLKKYVEAAPDLEEVCEEIKTELKSRLMRHPFRMILTQFIPNTKFSFEECIDMLLKKLYTTTLTDNICGMTLLFRVVILRRCTKKEYELAALLYILLHESAHFLQRVNNDFLEESNRPSSASLAIKLDTDEDNSEEFGEWSNKAALKKIAHFRSTGSLKTQTELRKEEQRKENDEQEEKNIERNQPNKEVIEKIINEEEHVKNEEKTRKNKEKTIKNDEKTVKNEEETVKIEQETVKIEQETVKIEQEQVENKEKSYQIIMKQEEIKFKEKLDEPIKENFKKENPDEIKLESDKIVNQQEDLKKVEEDAEKLTEMKAKEDYKESILNKTINVPGIEGGAYLELALFGQRYEILFLEGAEFLLSDLTSLTFPQFRKLFNEKNKSSNNDTGYPLRGCNFYVIGSCPGFAFV